MRDRNDFNTIDITNRTSFTSLTLAGLRDLVEQAIIDYGEDALVATKADYGDYSHTMQVLPFDGSYDLTPVCENLGYSRTDVAVYENDDADNEFDGDREYPAGDRPRVVIFN